jgi:hypothetical protein
MDYDTIARELLRAIRGARSQAAFSRRLGYRANVVHAWESGRRWPAASEFLRVAALAGVDVQAALRRFYVKAPPWLGDGATPPDDAILRILRDHQGADSVAAISRRACVGRYTVARWLAGTVEPRLPDFLRMIQATSLRLIDFIGAFVPPDAVPSIASDWRRIEAQRGLANESPWAMAVLRCLELRTFDGTPETIAETLSLSPDLVARCLDALRAAGLAEASDGRWCVLTVDSVDTRRTPETARRLKGFWARVALERLEGGSAGAHAYNLASVSNEQAQRLRALHDAYYQAARAIVAEDAPPECVMLMNWQLVRLVGA